MLESFKNATKNTGDPICKAFIYLLSPAKNLPFELKFGENQNECKLTILEKDPLCDTYIFDFMSYCCDMRQKTYDVCKEFPDATVKRYDGAGGCKLINDPTEERKSLLDATRYIETTIN